MQDHVAACIASLRAQTHENTQVLLIDDGSTDASAARARAAMGDDPRFTLISQDNAGLSTARNAGLEAAMNWILEHSQDADFAAPFEQPKAGAAAG